jgi:hypothetical protein
MNSAVADELVATGNKRVACVSRAVMGKVFDEPMSHHHAISVCALAEPADPIPGAATACYCEIAASVPPARLANA